MMDVADQMEFRRLRERIAELEARCPKCGMGHKVCNCMVAIANAIGLEQRIEECEKQNATLETYAVSRAKQLTDRIEALEQGQPVFDGELREAERKRLWHATYNAALQGCLSSFEAGSLMWDRAGALAKQFADEMHGPLEAT